MNRALGLGLLTASIVGMAAMLAPTAQAGMPAQCDACNCLVNGETCSTPATNATCKAGSCTCNKRGGVEHCY